MRSVPYEKLNSYTLKVFSAMLAGARYGEAVRLAREAVMYEEDAPKPKRDARGRFVRK